MGAALFIVLSKDDPGFDQHVNGKTVAKHYEKLEKLAKRLEVDPLSGFESIDSEEEVSFLRAEGFTAEEIEEMFASRGRPTGPDWHGARAGLSVVRTLIAHLTGKGKRTKGAAEIVEDLQGFERVLESARKRRLKFHLQWDF